jgi:predicted PurR-regulated permease PerM
MEPTPPLPPPPPPTSPTWSTNTKLLIGATALVIVGALVVRFWSLLTPLLVAFILAYLLHPVASFLQRRLAIPWAVGVSGIYTLALLIMIVVLGIGGFGLVQQVTSLITLIQDTLSSLPQVIADLSDQSWQIGPFVLHARNLPLSNIGSQVVAAVRPVLGQTGTLLAALAEGAIVSVGRFLFIVIISYFLLIESTGIGGRIVNIHVPRYEDDLRRLGTILGRIWNAFLRGQVIMFLIAILAYSVLLTVLGVHFAFGLALLAGLARFLPYIGPAINWIVLGSVAFFQEFKLFGLSAWEYTALVLGLAILLDVLLDNMVVPRMMSRALRVHPAAVIVAVLIAAELMGFVGVLIAAPILATALLVGRYVVRKLMDQDPFPSEEAMPPQRSLRARVKLAAMQTREWIRSRRQGVKSEVGPEETEREADL